MSEALATLSHADIPGWDTDDHHAALLTFQRSAREILAHGQGFRRIAQLGGTREDWLDVCKRAEKATDAKTFFTREFVAFKVHDASRPQGLFTGYYEPETEGSLTASPQYPVAIYRKPDDLVVLNDAERKATGLSYGRRVNGKPLPYFTRREIEEGALRGRGLELCFVKSWVDAFFIHIQGSGQVRLSDGKSLHLSFAAKSGLPYVSIGAELLKRGFGTPDTMSMQYLRHWLASHPAEARALLWHNPSFIFFQTTSGGDASLGAIGAAKVQLTPQRSLAVDRTFWAFGTPLYLDTHLPPEAKAGPQVFRQLMIAQDTGSAIKGLVRGDVYWGWGSEAELISGHMKSPGQMVALLPKAVAERLPQ